MSRSIAIVAAGVLALCAASVVSAAVTEQELDRAVKLHRKGAQALRSGHVQSALIRLA